MSNYENQMLLLTPMNKKITCFSLLFFLLLSFSWNSIHSILSWYSGATAGDSPHRLPAIYASVLFGAVFGLLSMAAALAVAIPAMLVTWITILVLLACAGKRRRFLVLEGRKITMEIAGYALRIMVREGNLVAAVFAVLSFVLLKRRDERFEI